MRGAGRRTGLRADVIVEKKRDSAFHRTALGELLRERGVSSYALCGVSTESCIATTATNAYAHDNAVVLIGDALASVDKDAHHHALDRLTTQYRQPVSTVADLTFRRSSGQDA